MMNWKDVMVTQERNKDLLREAEKQRLINQANAAAEESMIWRRVKELFASTGKNEWVEDAGYTASLEDYV